MGTNVLLRVTVSSLELHVNVTSSHFLSPPASSPVAEFAWSACFLPICGVVRPAANLSGKW